MKCFVVSDIRGESKPFFVVFLNNIVKKECKNYKKWNNTFILHATSQKLKKKSPSQLYSCKN